ncbi:hypothetical protein VPFG_00171 [Vibrio phage nt-1]|uniref:Uncharacterized protein n=1 Tax=Vibrio phage nt-1 TaxID=115992 RepID=R9TGF0_9CAUD|nr:hypothetical protein VPFG_00171 [Vibrio phage nt-1]AGN30173.2 hypothetical protein VPFG_00171 [Vibrio phage nt-1]
MIIEYVMSATGHARLSTAYKLRDKVDITYLRDILNAAQNLDGVHKISMLYNAYTEKKIGRELREIFGDSVYKIHVDSGGLQMITLGLDNTPELRAGVYKNQAESGDIGMCFDEIPIHNTSKGGGAARLNANDKVFISDMAYEYGVRSGKNIKDQIEAYLADESQCKPYVIFHGNTEEDYMNYCDGMMSQLKGLEHHIAGCAVSGAAIGYDSRETIDMMSVVRKLNIPEHIKKSVHMLGFGSVKRLLPSIALIRSGYFGDDFHISYDSSTHTGCLTNREYTDKLGRRIKIEGRPQKKNKDVQDAFSMMLNARNPGSAVDESKDSESTELLDNMLSEVWGRFSHVIPRSESEFKDFATKMWFKKLNRESLSEEDQVFEVACNLCIILSQILNFQAIVSEAFDLDTDGKERDGFVKWSSKRRMSVLDDIITHDSPEDFENWYKNNSKQLPSIRIRRGTTAEYPDFKS